MAVTCMCRRSQLCTPPSTQTPESFKRRSACAARSNVLVSAAAQHGEGEALRHRRRACAALRGSAAGVLARDERLSRSERRTPTPVFLLPLNAAVGAMESHANTAPPSRYSYMTTDHRRKWGAADADEGYDEADLLKPEGGSSSSCALERDDTTWCVRVFINIAQKHSRVVMVCGSFNEEI